MVKVAFKSMSKTEVERFLPGSIQLYAQLMVDHQEYDLEKAIELAEKEVYGYFDHGTAKATEFLFKIVNKKNPNQNFGDLWISISYNQNQPYVFLQWIGVKKMFRNQGIAKSALRLLETKMKESSLSYIDLSVFSENKSARHVYEGIGYQETEREKHGNATTETRIRMRKMLNDS